MDEHRDAASADDDGSLIEVAASRPSHTPMMVPIASRVVASMCGLIAVAAPAGHADPDPTTASAAAFVHHLADSLAFYAESAGPSWTKTHEKPPSKEFSALYHLTQKGSLPPAEALDSMARIWKDLTPHWRGQWLFDMSSGATTLVPVVADLARDPAALEAVDRYATRLTALADSVCGAALPAIGSSDVALDDLHERMERRVRARRLLAAAAALTGDVLSLRGDTTKALIAWLGAARGPSTREIVDVRRHLVALTAGRPEWRRERLLALTTAYLTTTERPEKDSLRVLLEPAYREYLARSRGPAPDLVGQVRAPEPMAGATLDQYLDRQFELLYDRDFAMASASPERPTGKRTRFVIGEFITGIH